MNKLKLSLLFIFTLFGRLLLAQSFTEASPPPPFDGVYLGSVAFSDIDGDNDQDVLITGWPGPAEISKLYRNDGTGNFTEMMNTPFEGVELSSIAFSDIDGDNDQDLLITGESGSTTISKLYNNDGTGNYTEIMNTPFEGVELSSIAFSDIDGDNDQDVLITGYTSPGRISKLYRNDGIGNYSEVMNTPFEGVEQGAIAFADIDGDNDQDVLITGMNDSNDAIAKLYINNGVGDFNDGIGNLLEGVHGSSIAFSDIDSDDDQDLLITGYTGSSRISKLYTNDGTGSYSEVMNTPFDAVSLSSIAFSDIDNDNDQDVLITGRKNSNNFISKLYTNDGIGNFIEAVGTPFDGVQLGSIAFADIDGDNDQDLLITGENITEFKISKLYINETMISAALDLVNPLNFEFTLYPNPTSGNKINICYHSRKNDLVHIKLFDLNGKLLIEHQELTGIDEWIFSLDVSSFNKGVYLIQLDNGEEKGVQKLEIN